MSEQWLPLKDYPNYEINRNGQVRNASGKILKPHSNRANGPLFLVLQDKTGKTVSPRVEKLVADTFFDSESDNPNAVLVHLDGDNSNCSVENLAWVEDDTAEKEYFKKTGIRKPKDYFVFYPIVDFPDSNYEINKVGQVRNKYTHKLLKGGTVGGYLNYTLYVNNKMESRRAHILVAKQFIPNPENKPLVNHKDENKFNPCVDNLEWVTPSENLRYGNTQNKTNQGRFKQINEYDVQGKYIRTWKSLIQLSGFFDTIYPEVNNNSNLRRIIKVNSQANSRKLLFANRVFIYCKGNYDNLLFQIQEVKQRKYQNHTLDGVEVPSEYLAPKEDLPYHLSILTSMLASNFVLSLKYRRAIQFAIDYIEKNEKT